jgi:hypothetical protein
MVSVAEFYGSHPITCYVASRLNGGYGTYARILATHLPKHLPGKPAITCEPMEEGSGLRLTKELATTLPRDGSVIAAIQGANCIESLLNPTGELQFDARELGFLGSISRQNNTVITWHTSDIRSIDDCRTREVIAGADNIIGNVGTMPRLLNAVLGTRFRTVHGYGPKGLEQAFERGEVEAICGFGYSTMMVAHPEWLKQKKIRIIAHTGLAPDPMMPGVPCILDYARTEDDRRVIRLMDIRQAMGRPYAAPPDLPADRLAALRQAFASTMKDPDFLADAKANDLVVDPMSHERMAETVAGAYALPAEVIQRTRDILKSSP